MYIQRSVDQIMSMNIEGLDMQKYMGMYTAVHNYCSMNRLSEGRSPGGRALYANLVDYLTHHLSHVRTISAQHHDEKLLSFFVEEWARYKMAALYLNHMFRYFNRHWVRQEIEQGRKNVHKFFDLCMLRWKMDVFDMLHEKAMESVLYIIEKQRNGECVGYSEIRRFIDSFSIPQLVHY
jgi:cullin 1